MWGETKRMLFNKNFLAAWLIACISIAIGQTYPSLKKALACGTFISILEGSLKSQAVSFAIPVAAVLPWSDSILQEYKSGFLKEILPRTTRRQYVEGKVFSIMVSGFMVWTLAILTVLFINFYCVLSAGDTGCYSERSTSGLAHEGIPDRTYRKYHKYFRWKLRDFMGFCLHGIWNPFCKLLFRNYSS